MGKALSEMTLEELWTLFPIILTEHKSYWKEWYEEEKSRILGFIGNRKVKLHHIGSTSIEGIWAKPIIDILMEIPEDESMEQMKMFLTKNGYLCMCEEEKRMSFNRGYTPHGFAEKVYHLHLRYEEDHDELYFRDYMNRYPEYAKEYETLKLSLWKQFEHNRDGYTEAKGEFVRHYTKLGKEERDVIGAV